MGQGYLKGQSGKQIAEGTYVPGESPSTSIPLNLPFTPSKVIIALADTPASNFTINTQIIFAVYDKTVSTTDFIVVTGDNSGYMVNIVSQTFSGSFAGTITMGSLQFRQYYSPYKWIAYE